MEAALSAAEPLLAGFCVLASDSRLADLRAVCWARRMKFACIGRIQHDNIRCLAVTPIARPTLAPASVPASYNFPPYFEFTHAPRLNMPTFPASNAVKISALLLLLSNTAMAQTEVPAATEAAPAETFDIPADIESLDQLMSFVEEIDATEPAGNSEQEVLAHQRKVARTVVAVAHQFSSQEKIADEEAMQGVYLKLQGLRILQQLDEPKADELFAKAIDAAQSDERADVKAVGTKFMVESGFSQWATWEEEQRSVLIEKISKTITDSPPNASQIHLVITVVGFLGEMNDEKYAAQLMATALPHFQTSEDPELRQMLSMLEGIKRRMELPGNEMELTGTLLDGTQLDWDSYRGKVVLIDYWASWCPPCIAELPNVKKLYEAYHDKGFEVLGINLDDTPEKANYEIERMELPWPSLFSENESERGWEHPMAVRYGITGIPVAILVDREGKVVSMTARGANLGRQLRRLLGEPVARSQQAEDSIVQQATPAATGN